MHGRLFLLSALALVVACAEHTLPTEPSLTAPSDPSEIISDGAHNNGNPDFFFLPPMVPLPLHNAKFELGKFNNQLKPSLKIEICQLQATPVNAKGLPKANTPCVAGAPLKTFAPGSVQLVNLPLRQNGWWRAFGLPDDGFYYVLWDTRQSNLNVNKYYRIKVFVAGSPDVLLGIADVDPMSSLSQWKFTLTGEVIQLIDDVMLPIPFRVENGGGSALCGDAVLCTSMVVTNDNPNGDFQVVPAQGNNGPIAGAVFPDGWLPVGPGRPTSVVVTIRSVNTGVNDVATGTQANPCHANLPLQQFNGCFNFTTTPALAPLEDGSQFALPVTVVVCYVLHDTEDPREPWVQLWSSGPDEPAHPLASASDALVLTAPTEHNCGSNFLEVIGSNAPSNAFARLAGAGWRKFRAGLGRLAGVQTAYAVDLGLGGITKRFSNVGPALTAEIQRSTATDLQLGAGATTTATARIVGTRVHNGGASTAGIAGLPVTFTVASGNGTLRLVGSEAPPALQVTSITDQFNPEEPGESGGFAGVNWTVPSTAGTYTLTASGPATGGPVTFTATVGDVVGFSALQGSMAAGSAHTCGLTTGGLAYCWGYPFFGELGNGSIGSMVAQTIPVAVSGGLTFSSILSGESHTCALTSGGTAYCWGYGIYGQLGDGTATNSGTPVAVSGDITFASLKVGELHTCGLTGAGAAYCWGDNEFGQQGDGTTSSRVAPVAVLGELTFTSLAPGYGHTCGLVTGGSAYCWGYNGVGDLGNGTTGGNSTTPGPVAGGLTFSSLVAGFEHTCGLTSVGAAHCWGYNFYGQLGDGSTTNRDVPVAVSGGHSFVSLTAGFSHTCGLSSGGTAYCWGLNASGELGDGTTTDHLTPVAVSGGIAFTSLTTGPGGQHTCGVTSTGTTYCWGNNGQGELGDGTTTDRSVPTRVVSP